MSDALSISLGGLNSAATRIAKSAENIANASLTTSTSDLSANLVAISEDKNNYAANAKVAHVVDQNTKTLLNILA